MAPRLTFLKRYKNQYVFDVRLQTHGKTNGFSNLGRKATHKKAGWLAGWLAELGWAGLSWAELGWAGLSWAELGWAQPNPLNRIWPKSGLRIAICIWNLIGFERSTKWTSWADPWKARVIRPRHLQRRWVIMISFAPPWSFALTKEMGHQNRLESIQVDHFKECKNIIKPVWTHRFWCFETLQIIKNMKKYYTNAKSSVDVLHDK